jgi:branched-subunit amino acid permease
LIINVINSNDVDELSSKIGNLYENVFIILLYTMISSFFDLSRFTITFFESGIKIFIYVRSLETSLLLYSIVYFILFLELYIYLPENLQLY